MAVLTPMPSARVNTVHRVKPGLLANRRKAYQRSRERSLIDVLHSLCSRPAILSSAAESMPQEPRETRDVGLPDHGPVISRHAVDGDASGAETLPPIDRVVHGRAGAPIAGAEVGDRARVDAGKVLGGGQHIATVDRRTAPQVGQGSLLVRRKARAHRELGKMAQLALRTQRP